MKNKSLLLLCTTLLLTGCSGAIADVENSDQALITIGDTTITKGQEYDCLKTSNGSTLTMELIKQDIYKKEVKVTKAMKKKAQEQIDSYKESMEDFESQIQSLGYSDADEYMEKVLIPSLQAEALQSDYFTEAKADIKKEYKPSKAQIIECSTKKNAKKALKALKEGKTVEEVATQYAAEEATYTGDETIVTTKTESLPTRLINQLYKADKNGVIDEVFANDGESTTYVAVLVTNTYKDLKEDLATELSSDSDVSNACLVYYLKKYNFEVHDQIIFDTLKANNPEYLVSRPDLSETDESQS